MLPFAKVTLADFDWAAPLMNGSRHRASETCFITCYMWQHRYQVRLCRYSGFVLSLEKDGGVPYYRFPLGHGDLHAALLALEDDAALRGIPFRLACLTQDMRGEIEAVFPARYRYTEQRDIADYLYLTRDMIDLPGKKYHAKRNHLNRFRSHYAGRWSYEPLLEEHIDEIWAFEREWERKNDAASHLTLRDEQTAIALLLYNFSMLGALGGVLRIDGKVVGFTLASRVSPDTMDIHIEKADYDIPGAYQMIFHAFVSNQCADTTFISREDDMGLPGLRKSKLSYNPAEILMKYEAVPV